MTSQPPSLMQTRIRVVSHKPGSKPSSSSPVGSGIQGFKFEGSLPDFGDTTRFRISARDICIYICKYFICIYIYVSIKRFIWRGGGAGPPERSRLQSSGCRMTSRPPFPRSRLGPCRTCAVGRVWGVGLRKGLEFRKN